MTFFPFSILHNKSNILESLSVRLDVTACNVTLSVFDGFLSKERTEEYLVSARLAISSFDSRPITPLKPSEASGGSWSCCEDFPPPFFFAGVVVTLLCFFFAGFNLTLATDGSWSGSEDFLLPLFFAGMVAVFCFFVSGFDLALVAGDESRSCFADLPPHPFLAGVAEAVFCFFLIGFISALRSDSVSTRFFPRVADASFLPPSAAAFALPLFSFGTIPAHFKTSAGMCFNSSSL
mmetsp:Transcript_34328/g.72221  ORF Transcript_34328/g.72221 Transcript_34328/m.72221 type:complete len:235 (-) Transcript_34328:1398-2102(-)